MEDSEYFTMHQVSKILNASSQKLRRYCNSGFVPGLRPTILGKHRVFDASQVEYLRIAVFLIRAGFTTKDLRKYIKLSQSHNSAATAERLAMLRTHKRQVWQELEDLQATIDFIERQEETLNSNEASAVQPQTGE